MDMNEIRGGLRVRNSSPFRVRTQNQKKKKMKNKSFPFPRRGVVRLRIELSVRLQYALRFKDIGRVK